MSRYLAVALLASGAGLLARIPDVHPADCAQLSTLKLAHTEITLAESVAAGAFKLPPGSGGGGPGAPPVDYTHLPAFCRVAGTLRPTADSDIRFEVWMPASGWN